MPPKLRRCSECQTSISDRPAGTKTCSQSCRQKRARRIKRARAAGIAQSKYSPEVQELAKVARGEVKDAIHEEARELVRPLVQEAMTEEVLSSIGRLTALMPSAIGALQDDLASSDETIRQRAYTLLLKYTMGNPSVAPPPAQQQPQGMNVVFNIPRPGDTTAPESTPAEAVELKRCGDCNAEKPEHEFVAGSDRCQACFDALQAKLADRFRK